MISRDLWSSSNRIEENLFTGLKVNTIVMALMWRIDRGDWPYYWICCCCLTKLTHMGGRLKSESTLHSRGWQDSVTDVVIMMFMLESFCLFWIIIPVAWHPVWLWPGGTPVSDLMWNSVLWFVEPDHRHHSVSRSTSPQSPNAGPWSPDCCHLHIPGDNILLGMMITIYFGLRLRKHSLYKPLDANYFRINWWLHNSDTHSIEN